MVALKYRLAKLESKQVASNLHQQQCTLSDLYAARAYWIASGRNYDLMPFDSMTVGERNALESAVGFDDILVAISNDGDVIRFERLCDCSPDV